MRIHMIVQLKSVLLNFFFVSQIQPLNFLFLFIVIFRTVLRSEVKLLGMKFCCKKCDLRNFQESLVILKFDSLIVNFVENIAINYIL